MSHVVITGSKGGTGISIERVFREAGYSVLGVDLKNHENSDQNYRQADLQNGAEVYDVLSGADAVVHFGSYPTDTWTSWERAYLNLSLGGYHILQACATLGIRRLVMASSPEIYGDYSKLSYLPLDESTPAKPVSIYGAVKQNLETLAEHYVRWHGMSIAALRPQRIVYEGSYDWRFRKYTESDQAAADALWAYVDARDVATACLAWVESSHTGCEIFNIAADDVCVDTPTRQLVEKYYGSIGDVRSGMVGRETLVDCQKIKQMLNWEPRHNWKSMEREKS